MHHTDHQSIKNTHSLPCVFGRCLGVECIDPQTINIKTPKKIPQKEPQELEILTYATKNLPLSGKLASDDRGFVYLDISNAYIYELISLLKTPTVTKPPYFDTLYKKGAHITVIPTSETPTSIPSTLFTEEIPFTLTGCYFVEPENWLDIETVWFLTIEAPRLSEIRTSLGLLPKIDNHEFHITFAVKKRFLSIHDIFSTHNQSIVIKNS